MQIMMATSRSIHKDRIFQSEQDKRHEIHLQKIKQISQMPIQPIKIDPIHQKHLKKAKSASKLFEQQSNKLIQKLQNKSLLNRIINIQPSIKTIRIGKSLSAQKLLTTTSNWPARKKQSQKIEKQRLTFIKHCETISTINVRDVKRKMQDQIRQYIELKNSIRKMKPSTASDDSSRIWRSSSKKISMGFPLWNDSVKVSEDVNNQEDKIKANQEDKIKANQEDKIKANQEDKIESKGSKNIPKK